VLVVLGVRQEHPHVAEERGCLEDLAGLVAEAVALPGRVEELEGEAGDLSGVRGVLVHELAEVEHALPS
jgi:hypothetical protein